MNVCKNCQMEIEDMRKAVRCSECGAHMHKDCIINSEGTYCDICFTIKEQEGTSEENGNGNIVIPDVIRRSYIETYKSCPFKFYMEVIKEIEPPNNIYVQLGRDIHKIVENLCNNPSYRKEDMLYDFHNMWYNYNSELFESEEQKEKMYNRALSSIDNVHKIVSEMPEPLCTEKNIQFGIGEGLPEISATMDRIDSSGNELEIHDWKTGAVLVGKSLSSDLQAPLYIYGTQQAYDMPVKRFTFHYLEDNKQRVFEKQQDNLYICQVKKREYHVDLIEKIKEVQGIFSQIKRNNFNVPRETKSMYFTCKMCHLRQKGMCQGAEMESWKQYN